MQQAAALEIDDAKIDSKGREILSFNTMREAQEWMAGAKQEGK